LQTLDHRTVDRLEDAFRLPEHFVIPKTEDANPVGLRLCGPGFVTQAAFGEVVLPAIELDS
jgi:hypothetical protein